MAKNAPPAGITSGLPNIYIIAKLFLGEAPWSAIAEMELISGWIIMEKIQDVKGLGGMLNGFRDLVKDDKRIVFVGSPGFCTPFALFLGYPVREKELVFLPGLDMNKARSITATEYGMELGGAASVQADAVVILGGMAMPKIGVKPEEMREFLSKMKYKKLIGVCFMSIFEKAGWCQALPFQSVMNIILEGDVSR
jgi:hypothetical protein